MTVAGLLRTARERLDSVSPTPALDAELLLARVLEESPTWLKTWPEKAISQGDSERFEVLLCRRLGGEPIAYILGSQPFWTLDLRVSPDTLIPRPETELLVETVLALMPAEAPLRVIDLGTGTGAIALALASERPRWHITACDDSAAALAVATANRDGLGLEVSLVRSDWFDRIEPQVFDVVVSNPPYIESGDRHLSEGDLRFEPAKALVSGEDGLADIRRIVRQSAAYLAEGGLLILEHGFDQAAKVRDILEDSGYAGIVTCRDLSGHERATYGFRPGHSH